MILNKRRPTHHYRPKSIVTTGLTLGDVDANGVDKWHYCTVQNSFTDLKRLCCTYLFPRGEKKVNIYFQKELLLVRKSGEGWEKYFCFFFYLFHKIVKMQYSTVMKGAGSVSDWVEEKTSPFTYLH